jgi:hypothetical protein
MYKEAAVLSALMKVYTKCSNDRGHVNVMLVLQNCTDSLNHLLSPSFETFPTSDCTFDFGNITVDQDVVIEESFVAANRQTDVGIKQEEICGDLTSPDIKAELNKVSYVCVYVCY